MAKMKGDFILRGAPNAPAKDSDPEASKGDMINVLESKDGWHRVALLDVEGEGWAPDDKVDKDAAPDPIQPIDPAHFAKQCIQDAVLVGVNAHFLMGAAHLRSKGIKDGKEQVDGKDFVGPFRLTADQWKSGIADPKSDPKAEPAREDEIFNLGFTENDIKLWRNQCTVVAVLVFRKIKELHGKGGDDEKLPSAVDLYKAMWPDDKSKLPDDLQASLNATAEEIKKAAPLVLDDPPPEPSLPKASDPVSPMNPKGGTATAPETAAGSAKGEFSVLAPRIMKGLMPEFGLSVEQAAAILGNIGHECAGFKKLQEGKPLSGIGGWGWAQWTGSRRRKFFAFCKANGDLPGDSYAANMSFLKFELHGKSTDGKPDAPGAIAAVKKGGPLEAMVKAFELAFERAHPNFKHYPSRNDFARRALAAFNAG